jgi:hypothetical protein
VSAQAIHDDLVATHGLKAAAYNMVTRYLGESKLGTAEVILDPEPSSLRLDVSDRAILASLEEKKSHFCPFENLPESPISHVLPSIEGSPNRSGSSDVFFAWYHTFCQMFKR